MEDNNLNYHKKMCEGSFKKLLSIFVIILAVFVAVKAYNGIRESKYIGKEFSPNSSITVSGTGEVFAKPDIAQISVSVEEEAKDIVEAQSKNAESINKIMEYLRNSGVEDKDIKTTNYNIYPRYDYLENRGRVFRGYNITQSLEIKIRNLKDAGKILAGVTEMGANQVGGIFFVIDDQDAVKRDARDKALEKAKEKAKELAKDLDVKLGRILDFSESDGYTPIYRAMGGEMSLDKGFVAPEIPVGENKISITVNLTYEIK